MKKNMISNIRKKTHDGVDKVMDKAEYVSESGKEKFENLQEKATVMREDLDEYIRENPEKSVLIAAGVGAVVGLMLAALVIRRR
jgi:ElaB/YqjD/DUF883 family membrane-anchored ribosome-binding protein